MLVSKNAFQYLVSLGALSRFEEDRRRRQRETQRIDFVAASNDEEH